MKNHNGKFTTVKAMQNKVTVRWLTMMLLLPLLAMAYFAHAEPAQPATQTAVAEKFDHAKTGFPLTGAHTSARCTSCHINNVFKGVPRDCATCHRAGNQMAATAKPNNHINTNAQCDTCHKTTVWTPATFSHVSMASGDCATCHNGTTAQGKPTRHIPVPATVSCDNCHKTTTWLQVAFSHKGINGGCTDCHTGQAMQGMATPKGKPGNHMATSLDCVSCHTTIDFVVLKQGAPVSLPTGHFTTTQPCSVCHSGGSFLPGRMNHAGIMGGCVTCHNGTAFLGVTPRSKASANPAHMTTSAPCETCHTSTSTFLVANLTIPPAGHMPTTATCGTCHGISGYGLGSGLSNSMATLHTNVASGCANCHTSGKSFLGLAAGTIVAASSNHVPTTRVTNGAACETCHTSSNTAGFTSFTATAAVTTMKHTGIVNGCTDCHNNNLFASVTPVSKATTAPIHIPTSNGCEVCHSTVVFNSFAGAIMRHTGVTTCKECHNGNTFQTSVVPLYKAPGGTTNHNPANAECSGCHNTTTFSSAVGGMPTNHVPTTIASCSTCHAAGYDPTTTKMSHAGVNLTNCAMCHNGQAFYGNGSPTGFKAVSKANFPPHVATSLDCSNCHSTKNFTSFAGATGGTMPLNHLPTTQPCSTCHTSFGSGSGVMSHVGIVSGCANCHNGQTFAVNMKPTSKPTNHVPTSTACETCHATNVFTSFAGTKMNHAGISSGCAGCHGAGMSFIGGIVTYPSNHVPTAGVTNGALCETCHSKTNFATFSGTAMVHTGLPAGSCDSCHTNDPFAGVTPLSVPSTHIPYATSLLNGSTMKCDFCHKLTTIGGFATLSVTSPVLHNNTPGGAPNYCVNCHLRGKTYLGVRTTSSHNGASTARDCSSSGCHRPLGNEGSSYNSW